MDRVAFPRWIDEDAQGERELLVERNVQPTKRLVTFVESGMQFSDGREWHVMTLRLLD